MKAKLVSILIILIFLFIPGCSKPIITDVYNIEYFTFQYDILGNNQSYLTDQINSQLSINEINNITNTTFSIEIEIVDTNFYNSISFEIIKRENIIELYARDPNYQNQFKNFEYDKEYQIIINFLIKSLDINITDKISIWGDNQAQGFLTITKAKAPYFRFDAIILDFSEGKIQKVGRNIRILQLPMINDIILKAYEVRDT